MSATAKPKKTIRYSKSTIKSPQYGNGIGNLLGKKATSHAHTHICTYIRPCDPYDPCTDTLNTIRRILYVYMYVIVVVVVVVVHFHVL